MDKAASEKYIRKVTWAGLAINLTLSGFKFAAGIAGASQAVVADAIHSLSDSLSDLFIIAGSYFWTRPPDLNHQYGHHRIETFVTILIGSAIFVVGIGIAWEAIDTIHEKRIVPPCWIAALAAAVSIVCKEALYRWTALAAKRVKSSALAANALHHRSDALSSIPALLSVTGAIIFPTWSFLDHLGAALVSVFIIQAAFTIIRPAIREIMDVAAPETICERIKTICLENTNVRQVHKIRTRYIGMNIQADFHILVDGSMTVSDGHDVAGEVKNRILSEMPKVVDVLIHIEPSGMADFYEECL